MDTLGLCQFTKHHALVAYGNKWFKQSRGTDITFFACLQLINSFESSLPLVRSTPSLCAESSL